MTVRSRRIQLQYLRSPESAFSIIGASHQVVDLRFGAQARLAPERGARPQQIADRGLRIPQVAEDQRFRLAGLHAGRRLSLGQTLFAEVALLPHPATARGELRPQL